MVHCSFCNSVVECDPKTRGGQISWCPKCHRVFSAPLFLTPGWIAGVLVTLVLTLQV
jgi:hypothetical protein